MAPAPHPTYGALLEIQACSSNPLSTPGAKVLYHKSPVYHHTNRQSFPTDVIRKALQ